MARGARMVYAAALAALFCVASPASVRADDRYPFQANNDFTVTGTLSKVDPDRQRLEITTDSGRSYAVDAYDAHISLSSSNREGTVTDLADGMRVRLTGYMLGTNIIAADKLQVLSGSAVPAAVPPPARTIPPPPARTYQPEVIQLRGTVDSVDDTRGIVVVRIKDHVRTIHVSSSTDLTDIGSTDDEHIGVNPGDRITVRGLLLSDGTVNATGISRSRNLSQAQSHVAHEVDNAHQIVGQISHPSDKYSSRDIKVLVRPGREITVNVRHDATILRAGRPVSVHTLTTDDVVRVHGDYEGDQFRADRIEVLPTYPAP